MEESEPLDWESVSADFRKLEKSFEEFKTANSNVRRCQTECQKALAKQKKNIKDLELDLSRKRKGGKIPQEEYAAKKAELSERHQLLQKVALSLPMQTGLFLSYLLGNVNLTLPHMGDRFNYKKEYELFKLKGTILIILTALLVFFYPLRSLETFFHLLLGVYYFVLTVREFILIANGSRIQLWWRVHHYCAIAQSIVIMEWPEGATYDAFHMRFVYFSLYLGVVQLLQYQYQNAMLYKKRSLGQADPMETTTDLPTRRTFNVLILALVLAYCFQLNNAWFLFSLALSTPAAEIHVYAAAVFFALLGVGNMVTTLVVLQRKFSSSSSDSSHQPSATTSATASTSASPPPPPSSSIPAAAAAGKKTE